MTKILKIFITAMLAMFTGIANIFAYEAGDIIEFGLWPAEAKGEKAQPIEWEILEKKSDGTAIVLSSKVIDVKPYNTGKKDITWAESSLRRWLNEEFYSKAFTAEEKDAIAETRLENKDNIGELTQEYVDYYKKWGIDVSAYLGRKWHTKGGADTTDKVWLLSLEDMQRYGRRFSTDESRTAKPTQYLTKIGTFCVSDICKKNGAAGNAAWWLRSPGDEQSFAAYVYNDGFVYSTGDDVSYCSLAVRPALKINLKNLKSSKYPRIYVADIVFTDDGNAELRTAGGKKITAFNISSSQAGGTAAFTMSYAEANGFEPEAKTQNKYGVAVIIGVRNYENKVPPVFFALNDAQAVRDYAVKALGYSPDNIIYVQDPTKVQIEEIFGTDQNHKGKLYNYLKPGKSDVFIYYSGHGAFDQDTKEAYFVPKDANPGYIKVGGYAMETMYANLAKLPARKITVVTDACFSGQTGEGKMIIRNAMPLAVSPKLPGSTKINVFNASCDREIDSWYAEKQHSMFTYYFLLGLIGKADSNKDKTITAGEISGYLRENIPGMARGSLYNREQNPVFSSDSNIPIAEYK